MVALMMKNLNKIIFWFLSVIACSILILGAGLFFIIDKPSALLKFLFDYQIIKENYFRDIDDNTLFNGATSGMVSSLGDPHSVFLSGEKYEDFMQSTSGEYGGIGVVIGADKSNAIHILSVFPDSNAEKSGVKAGDVILKIDGEDVSSLNLQEVSSKVRGQAGTEVSLDIERGSDHLTISVERSNVTMPTVQSRMIDNDIGYIHIFSFSKHTSDEFKSQLDSLKDKGAVKLIIDLRMNPGGMVDTVVSIMNQILTKGTVLSYHTKDGDNKNFDITGVEQPMPLAVLIDKNSASASEILAGAVQDKKEGIIVGETSYGKGTVQSVIPNGEKSALKVSIAEYRTAAGRVIDQVGIIPDVTIEQTGHIFDMSDDNVLSKAIELLK